MKVCIKFKNGINFTDEGSSIEFDEHNLSILFSKTVENKKYGTFVKIYSFLYLSIGEIIVDGKRFTNRMKPIEVEQIEITMKSHFNNGNDDCTNCAYHCVPSRFYPCRTCRNGTSFFIDRHS